MDISSYRAFEELKLFHSIDRTIYVRLLGLRFDPNQSKLVLAFWYFLDTETHYKFMAGTLDLHDQDLYALACESIICLQYLYSNYAPPGSEEIDSKFRTLCLLLLTKNIPLEFVFENKEKAREEMKKVMDNVFDRALWDIIIVPPYPYLGHIPSGFLQTNLLNGPILQQWFQHNYSLNQQGHNIVEAQPLLPPQEADDDVPDQYQPSVDNNDRTLFLTFSKGHPVSKEELKSYLNWKFGDCIESIFMKKPVHPSEQSLFAQVVAKSASDATRILDKPDHEGKVKFSVNGKDVKARRSKPRTELVTRLEGF
ncbi:uncharacterized protein [Pyrus communis]|uniref:uncharacterized protein n=1 Tax=Pyrus communis TaxID=23211 RepID=UPI0035C11EEF